MRATFALVESRIHVSRYHGLYCLSSTNNVFILSKLRDRSNRRARNENKGVELTGGGGTVEELWNAEAEGRGEPGLLLIEGVEGISPKNERARDVQHVERAGAQERSVRSCNLLCLPVSSGRTRDEPHHALLDIFAKESMDFHRLSGPQFLSEKPQSDGVEDFDFRHVSKEQRQDRAPHLGRGRGGIHVG